MAVILRRQKRLISGEISRQSGARNRKFKSVVLGAGGRMDNVSPPVRLSGFNMSLPFTCDSILIGFLIFQILSDLAFYISTADFGCINPDFVSIFERF